MLSTISAAPTLAQLADTDDAIRAFAVTSREPDRDVHQGDVTCSPAQQERIEIAPGSPAAGCSDLTRRTGATASGSARPVRPVFGA